MFDGGHCRFEFLVAEGLVRSAQMLNEKSERNLLGNLERALALIHSFDSGSAVGGTDVERRCACTPPLVIGVKRRMNRIQRNAAAAEPFGNLFDMRLAVGIVHVLAGGEDF